MAEPGVAGQGVWAVGIAGAALLGLGIAAAQRPDGVVRRPRWVLAGCAALSLLALAALVRPVPPGLRLRLDPSTEPLLPAGDPAQAVYAGAVREFGDDEVYAIAMETGEGLFTRENLTTLRAVHDAIARLPGVRRVQSLADVATFRWVSEEDWIEVGPLFDEVPSAPAALAALRARALGDPLLLRNFVSADGRTAGLSVRFVPMRDARFLASRLDERIAAVLRGAERPGVRFHVAGRPHAKAVVYHGMLRDLRVLVPIAVAVLAAVLALAAGSRRGVALPLGGALLAVLWTYGAMAVLGRPITILSSMLGPQLLAIGSVYGVHFLGHYDEERGAGSAREVAARTLAAMRLPVAISGITTQIGFAAICWTRVPAVLEMGAFSVFGTGCITFLTLTALPAALALLPPRRERSVLPPTLARGSERFVVALDRGLAALGAFAARRAEAVLAIALLAAGVAAWAVPRIVVDTDYLSFFDDDAPVRRDFAAVNRLLAGAIPIYVVVAGDGPGTFRAPTALRALEALEDRVDRLPGVSRTLSLVDTLRQMNRAVERDDPSEARIPDDRRAVSELLQLAPKDEMERFVNVNQSRANLVVRTGAVGSAAVRDLDAALRAAIRAVLPPPLAAQTTANAILLARSADGIARSQGRSVGLAALAILLLVAGALRSATLGVVALLPNVLPVLLFFGLLGLGLAPLSLPTSLIGAAALGIAVDDTVHFLVRYRRERGAGAAPREAARRTGLAVGRPIAVTSIMLAAGFAVIALSSFATLRQFGLLFATTVGLCLAADLLVLPALLVRLRA